MAKHNRILFVGIEEVDINLGKTEYDLVKDYALALALLIFRGKEYSVVCIEDKTTGVKRFIEKKNIAIKILARLILKEAGWQFDEKNMPIIPSAEKENYKRWLDSLPSSLRDFLLEIEKEF